MKLREYHHQHKNQITIVHTKLGKTEEGQGYLEELLSYSEQHYVSHTIFAVVYGALRKLNEAFKWLDLAYERRDNHLIMALYFWYNPICSDPRFKEMLKKIGLDK